MTKRKRDRVILSSFRVCTRLFPPTSISPPSSTRHLCPTGGPSALRHRFILHSLRIFFVSPKFTYSFHPVLHSISDIPDLNSLPTFAASSAVRMTIGMRYNEAELMAEESALKMAEEQRRTLFRPLKAVRVEFWHLDGQRVMKMVFRKLQLPNERIRLSPSTNAHTHSTTCLRHHAAASIADATRCISVVVRTRRDLLRPTESTRIEALSTFHPPPPTLPNNGKAKLSTAAEALPSIDLIPLGDSDTYLHGRIPKTMVKRDITPHRHPPRPSIVLRGRLFKHPAPPRLALAELVDEEDEIEGMVLPTPRFSRVSYPASCRDGQELEEDLTLVVAGSRPLDVPRPPLEAHTPTAPAIPHSTTSPSSRSTRSPPEQSVMSFLDTRPALISIPICTSSSTSTSPSPFASSSMTSGLVSNSGTDTDADVNTEMEGDSSSWLDASTTPSAPTRLQRNHHTSSSFSSAQAYSPTSSHMRPLFACTKCRTSAMLELDILLFYSVAAVDNNLTSISVTVLACHANLQNLRQTGPRRAAGY
ncbi:unnamed protein product [Cyclocybe aegerita]|uniref:Uncharacterized protein n=1 Tax=Cyclocybe aegerita TaxID=1973307 RepID=A0A8S0W0R7_CYCAE|nr:unnamed protein product [Cyclocybe aegerita]